MQNPVFEGHPVSAIETETKKDETNSKNSTANLLTVNQAKPKKGTSPTETLMHMIKANIGTGLLAMPLAFKNAGIIFGTLGFMLMAVICVYAIHVLLKLYNYIKEEGLDQNTNDTVGKMGYDDVIYLVAKHKCKPNSRIPTYLRTLISIFLVIGQLGFCCVYFVFIPSNITQVIKHYDPHSTLTVEPLMAIILGPMILYCMIRNLKYLAPFSTIANFLMIGSVLVILYSLFFDGELKPFQELLLIAPVGNWPTFFSSTVYAFEGIGCVLPVYHGMETKSFFTPFNGVLNTAMIIVSVMYYSIGLFGYLKYGSGSLASITLNLPVSNVIFQCVKVCFAIAVFITFNLQFMVGCDIIWSYIYRASIFLRTLSDSNQALPNNLNSSKHYRYNSNLYFIIENGFRTMIIILTFALASLIPKIDLFIAFIGAIASSSLAIIIPIAFDLIVFWPLENYSHKKLIKDILILLFGVYIFLAGTYKSSYDIIKFFKEGQ